MKTINKKNASLPFLDWANNNEVDLDEFKEMVRKAAENANKKFGDWWNKRPLMEYSSNEIWLHVHDGAILYWDLDCYFKWFGGESEDAVLEIKENFEDFALLNMDQIEVSYD